VECVCHVCECSHLLADLVKLNTQKERIAFEGMAHLLTTQEGGDTHAFYSKSIDIAQCGPCMKKCGRNEAVRPPNHV